MSLYHIDRLPPSSLLSAYEAISQYRSLTVEQDGLYFAFIYGLFEQICRLKSQPYALFIQEKLQQVLSRTDASLREPFQWLISTIIEASMCRISGQDCNELLGLSNFRNILKAFLKEILDLERVAFSPNLHRTDEVVLRTFTRAFNCEVAIYTYTNSNEEYERTEIFSNQRGPTVNIYQATQLNGLIETGLLYFQEFVNADLGSSARIDTFPFMCLPNMSAPMKVTRCNRVNYQQRFSNSDVSMPYSAGPKGPPNYPGLGSSYIPQSSAQPISPYHAQFVNPNPYQQVPTYDRGGFPPAHPYSSSQSMNLPMSANPPGAYYGQSCQVCNRLSDQELLYKDISCTQQCVVCKICMYEQGIPNRHCPKCRNRGLSDMEISTIQVYYASLRT